MAGVHTIMNAQTMPKTCTKQIETIPIDSYTNAAQVYKPTEECKLYASNNPSGYALTNSSTILSVESPTHWCACAEPCGPYVNSKSMYEPVVNELRKYEITTTALTLLTENAIVLWGLIQKRTSLSYPWWPQYLFRHAIQC